MLATLPDLSLSHIELAPWLANMRVAGPRQDSPDRQKPSSFREFDLRQIAKPLTGSRVRYQHGQRSEWHHAPGWLSFASRLNANQCHFGFLNKFGKHANGV